MEYVTATAEMADTIHHILQTTIRTVYPKYYPKEVTDFFCRNHSREHISEGIASGNMRVLMNGLEAEISEKCDTALLDASLPAVFLYEHRGYRTIGHGICELQNDVKLVYEMMEKKLKDIL